MGDLLFLGQTYAEITTYYFSVKSEEDIKWTVGIFFFFKTWKAMALFFLVFDPF